MDCHLALPISGSWSPGAAQAVDGASLLHSPLRVNRNAETEKKGTGGRNVSGRNVKAPKKQKEKRENVKRKGRQEEDKGKMECRSVRSLQKGKNKGKKTI
jgi:hypothetical protein